MDKPELKLPMGKMMNYNEVIDYIEDKHKIQVRDYARSFEHLDKLKKRYEKETGKKQREIMMMGSHEALEFTKWVKEIGEVETKPYQDFWHWLLDFDGELNNNPCRGYIPSPKHWDIPNPGDGELEPDKPDEWVLEILTYIHDEFKEHYEGNELEVWIEW